MDKKSSVTFKFSKYQVPRLSLALLISWFLFLSACGVQNELTVAYMSPTPTQEAETAQANAVNTDSTPTAAKHPATSEPTATPTTIATLIPSLTSTEIPAFDIATITPTEATAPLPTPTLSVEEILQRWQMIDAQVAAAMASNNGCQLPCWWGIELGDSVATAQQVFNTINENGWVDSPGQRGELQLVGFFKHIYRNEMGEDIYAGFSVDLLIQKGLLEVIEIYMARNVEFDMDTPEYTQIGKRLVRDWEQFSIKNVFKAFGEPDLIYLLPRAYGNEQYYDVNIYYPDLGIAVSYFPSVLIDEHGDKIICPDMFDLLSMNLFLYDPSAELPPGYLQAAYPLWPLSDELRLQLIEGSDLESRTGMSINEFVTFMLENESNDGCFTTN